MSKSFAVMLLVLTLLVSSVSIAVAGGFLVTVEKDILTAQEAEDMLVEKGYKIINNFEALNESSSTLIFSVEASDVETLGDISESLQSVTGILSVEEDQEWSIEESPTGLDVDSSFSPLKIISSIPNDPDYSKLWGMTKIQAPDAWDTEIGNNSGVVIVIDTGVNYNHPDLIGNMANLPIVGGGGTYGLDTYNDDNDPMDDHSHGSHCAGTIGAVGNNSVGVVGVNWKTRIGACKFLSSGGSGSTTDAIECMDYVIALKNAGVNVIATSNSWGGGGYSSALKAAIVVHKSRDILFIAASGNSATDTDSTPHYPASYDNENIIAVNATNSVDDRAWFSNYGATTTDLAAPGVDIYSTVLGTSYEFKDGTSMACPHVAGTVMLVHANGVTGWDKIKDKILSTVDVIPAMTGKCTTNGRLNLAKAVETIPNTKIVDFEGLDSIIKVPDGYRDFNWTDNCYTIHKDTLPGSGYDRGVVSGVMAAFGAFGAFCTMWKDEPFQPQSVYVNAAWEKNLTVEVEGLDDNGNSTGIVSTVVDCENEATFVDLTSLDEVYALQFRSIAGTHNSNCGNGAGSHWVIDDVVPNPQLKRKSFKIRLGKIKDKVFEDKDKLYFHLKKVRGLRKAMKEGGENTQFKMQLLSCDGQTVLYELETDQFKWKNYHKRLVHRGDKTKIVLNKPKRWIIVKDRFFELENGMNSGQINTKITVEGRLYETGCQQWKMINRDNKTVYKIKNIDY